MHFSKVYIILNKILLINYSEIYIKMIITIRIDPKYNHKMIT